MKKASIIKSINSICALTYSVLKRLSIGTAKENRMNEVPILIIRLILNISSISWREGERSNLAYKPDVNAVLLCKITLRGIYETPR